MSILAVMLSAWRHNGIWPDAYLEISTGPKKTSALSCCPWNHRCSQVRSFHPGQDYWCKHGGL